MISTKSWEGEEMLCAKSEDYHFSDVGYVRRRICPTSDMSDVGYARRRKKASGQIFFGIFGVCLGRCKERLSS